MARVLAIIAVYATIAMAAFLVSGGRLTVVASAAVGLVAVTWQVAWRRAPAIWASMLFLLPIIVSGTVPVDVRAERTGRLAARIAPMVWGPVTPETMARAPRGAVFAGRCIVPPIPTRYVLALEAP